MKEVNPRDAIDELVREREFSFTGSDFKKIADIFQQDAGIALSETKAPLVYSRLVKRLRKLGMESFERYCALVDSAEGSDERAHMIDALTTNVTRFFREPHHFEHLKTRVLPPLLDAARRGSRIRLWSAGCSTGEEPYSIALCILSLMRDAASFDIKVLATDINKQVLAVARAGLYRDAVLRPLNEEERRAWFTPAVSPEKERAWRARDELRALVAFRELNLIDDWPMKHPYHVIFFRNVAIYFEKSVEARIWSRLTERLAPSGWLYTGYSERLGALSGRFTMEGLTTYRLREHS